MNGLTLRNQISDEGYVGSKTTCSRLPGYLRHGPGALQVPLKAVPAASCSAIGLRKVAMALTTSMKFWGTFFSRFLRINPRHWAAFAVPSAKVLLEQLVPVN